MKVRRVIYFILAILFLLIDVLVTLTNLKNFQLQATGTSYEIGYRLGSQLFLYISLLFFYRSYLVTRKLKEKRQQEWNTTIDEIGNN